MVKENRIYSLILILSLSLNICIGSAQVHGKQLSSKALRSMARLNIAYSKFEKARPLAEKALETAKAGGQIDVELAMCHIDLATVYKSLGKSSQAEGLCKTGLEIQKTVLSKNHPYVAYTLRTLSSIYQDQNKLDQAESVLQEAMEIMLANHSMNDNVMAPFLVDTADLLVIQNKLNEADSYYQKAMVLINDSYGSNHLYTATVLCSIAKLYTLEERYGEAEKLIDKAVTIQEKFYGDHYQVSAGWLIKAKIFQARGDNERAENLISKALAAAEKSEDAAAYKKLQQYAQEIRASMLRPLGQVARNDK